MMNGQGKSDRPAAGAVGSGQGRHLGQQNKSPDDEGEQGEPGRGKGRRAYPV
jgi:hypothetical protein